MSVIISTCNRATFVRTSVESAVRQTLADQEVIVVDHGSTDETPRVLESFGHAILTIRLDPDSYRRPALARNEGAHRAEGEFVAFLDDDDLWEPTKNARQLEVMESQPEVALVSTDAHKIDDEGRVEGRYLEHTRGAEGDCFALLVKDNLVIASSAMVRRAALLSVGGFDENPRLRALEDYHLWLRLAARHPFGFVPEPLVRYRRHEYGISRGGLREALRARRRVLKAVLRDPAVRRKGILVLTELGQSYRASFRVALRGER